MPQPSPEKSPEKATDSIRCVCVVAWYQRKVVYRRHSAEATIARLGENPTAHQAEVTSILQNAGQPYDRIRVRFYSLPNPTP